MAAAPVFEVGNLVTVEGGLPGVDLSGIYTIVKGHDLDTDNPIYRIRHDASGRERMEAGHKLQPTNGAVHIEDVATTWRRAFR
jgi:hypothetical protein